MAEDDAWLDVREYSMPCERPSIVDVDPYPQRPERTREVPSPRPPARAHGQAAAQAPPQASSAFLQWKKAQEEEEGEEEQEDGSVSVRARRDGSDESSSSSDDSYSSGVTDASSSSREYGSVSSGSDSYGSYESSSRVSSGIGRAGRQEASESDAADPAFVTERSRAALDEFRLHCLKEVERGFLLMLDDCTDDAIRELCRLLSRDKTAAHAAWTLRGIHLRGRFGRGIFSTLFTTIVRQQVQLIGFRVNDSPIVHSWQVLSRGGVISYVDSPLNRADVQMLCEMLAVPGIPEPLSRFEIVLAPDKPVASRKARVEKQHLLARKMSAFTAAHTPTVMAFPLHVLAGVLLDFPRSRIPLPPIDLLALHGGDFTGTYVGALLAIVVSTDDGLGRTLARIDLSGNGMDNACAAAIFASLAHNTDLRPDDVQLDLTNNAIEGVESSNLAQCHFLSVVDMRRNPLHAIPLALFSMQRLHIVKISASAFHSTLTTPVWLQYHSAALADFFRRRSKRAQSYGDVLDVGLALVEETARARGGKWADQDDDDSLVGDQSSSSSMMGARTAVGKIGRVGILLRNWLLDLPLLAVALGVVFHPYLTSEERYRVKLLLMTGFFLFLVAARTAYAQTQAIVAGSKTPFLARSLTNVLAIVAALMQSLQLACLAFVGEHRWHESVRHAGRLILFRAEAFTSSAWAGIVALIAAAAFGLFGRLACEALRGRRLVRLRTPVSFLLTVGQLPVIAGIALVLSCTGDHDDSLTWAVTGEPCWEMTQLYIAAAAVAVAILAVPFNTTVLTVLAFTNPDNHTLPSPRAYVAETQIKTVATAAVVLLAPWPIASSVALLGCVLALFLMFVFSPGAFSTLALVGYVSNATALTTAAISLILAIDEPDSDRDTTLLIPLAACFVLILVTSLTFAAIRMTRIRSEWQKVEK